MSVNSRRFGKGVGVLDSNTKREGDLAVAASGAAGGGAGAEGDREARAHPAERVLVCGAPPCSA